MLKRRVVMVAGVMALAASVVVVWRWHASGTGRPTGLRAAEAVLNLFPPPAGAVQIERSVETLRSEQGHVSGHNLRLAYRLPADAAPQTIFDRYDSSIPNGWHRADGRDCLALMQTAPPSPSPGDSAPTTSTLVVSAPRTQRFYTDGQDTAWVRLAREPPGTVRLDISNRRGPPNCTAQPDGGPDPEADAFR